MLLCQPFFIIQTDSLSNWPLVGNFREVSSPIYQAVKVEGPSFPYFSGQPVVKMKVASLRLHQKVSLDEQEVEGLKGM